MCGIVGYVGKDNKAIKKTIDCLQKLEYRGYDSAGIAYVDKKKITIKKEKGRINLLKQKLNFNIKSNVAIGHTRWATHGTPSNTNAHPHRVGNVTIVHNGIIENYLELKKQLEAQGYQFSSQTDTEVACAMIDYLAKDENNHLTVLNKLKKIFKGSYALTIIFDDELDTLYALKKDNPLIIGCATNSFFTASDIPAILEYTTDYVILNDNDIAKINDELIIYHNEKKIKNTIHHFKHDYDPTDKGTYEHYMLKEINEQPIIINELIKKHVCNDLKEIPDLSSYHRIDIVGCGSAYHAGLVAQCLFEEYAKKETNCYVASEYRYKTCFLDKNSLVIFISQSGETADTLACLRKVKKQGIKTLAIVNTEESSIAREADEVIYTKAGQEIAVATTKAYTAQVTILSLLALKIANKDKSIYLTQLKKDQKQIKEILTSLIYNQDYKLIAKKLYNHKDIFFIGRLIDYTIALEGSLKLKEISYINSSTYPAGELKHGTISLIEKGTPVISIITQNSIKNKTISNIKEVKARNAYSIVLTNQTINNDIADIIVKIPVVSSFLQPIVSIIPLQLIAYYVAKLNNCDIDKPRNLAKSVTVE